MIGRWAGLTLGLVALAACGGGENADTAVVAGDTAAAEHGMAPAGEVPDVALACEPSGMPLADRPSPYDSTLVAVGGAQAKVCYGRPSMRGRTIFGEGGLYPYGNLWRTGANEATTIHTPVAATIAGLAVEPGSYTLYTIPGETEWTVIVNRSTSQWGIETSYTPEIEAQEVGRAQVPVERTASPVETFTISSEPAGGATNLVLEWENSRVEIPVQAQG